MSTVVANLSARRLELLEVAVNDWQVSFVGAGNALAEIQAAGLYTLAKFDSFESYLAERWDMTRSYASRVIAAAAVHSACCQLATEPPQNEAQCRELGRLEDPELQREAWQRAVDTAPGGKVTAKHVASVVKAMLAAPGGESTAPAFDIEAACTRMLRTIREAVERCPEDQREGLIDALSYQLGDLRRAHNASPTGSTEVPTPRAVTRRLPAPALDFDPYAPFAPEGDMDLPEDAALLLLGLRWDYTSDTLHAVFKRAAREAHPDRGGSHEQAARINAAFDLLKRVIEVVEPVEKRSRGWKRDLRCHRDVRLIIWNKKLRDEAEAAASAVT